ncbi:MAG: GDP-mannose 4,6-dehydratase [Acidobacteriia bacterium]|nr:GDP-mannose 4,6-dehydratase [Terriglobia bacterium]
MRALITGGAGFAGSHLAEHLLEQGQEVVALAAVTEPLDNLGPILPQVQVERLDLRDALRVSEIVREAKPQRVYHLAALSSPAESLENPLLTYEVNFTGTLNLLLACRMLGADCRILIVSSSEVYGVVRPEHLPLREDMALRPATPYAGSKAAAELLGLQFFESYGMPVVRTRPFNHTGPRQSAAFVCSDFARQIAEIDLGLRPPKIHVGNLQVSRDFSDVRDIVRGYHLLLEKGDPGEVYQLGSGRPVSIEEILRILIGLASQCVQVVVEESRVRHSETPTLWGDTSKAEHAVGWKRHYRLDTTLRDLKEYWQERLRSEAASRRERSG